MHVSSNPLTILMTDPHLKGGGQVRYVTNLARQLTGRGHRVIIGCRPGSVLIERAREAGCVSKPDFTFRGGLRLHNWWRDVRCTQTFIRETQPDVIHVSGSQDHWVTALANRLLGRPVCIVRTRHNTYPVHDAWPNRVLNRGWTDYQIVVCDVVRQTLARQRAFDADRMCSIHNGVDAEFYRPNPEARRRARDGFGYSDEDFVFGIAARLVPAKGHEFLIKAFSQIAGEAPHARLLVLGQGGLEQELRNLAQELGVAGRITFTGFRDDMADCVQAFDVGVQPSIDCDTSSFSLKEQMAAGKPVIASDYGGLTEIVEDGGEGLVVPAGTVEPLADAMRTIIRDPARGQRMGEAGRARVLREFTVEVFAERTEAAYRRAIEIHRERTAH